MQKLAIQFSDQVAGRRLPKQRSPVGTVHRISHYGMTDMFHMHSDLMGPPGVKFHFQIGEFGKAPDNSISRESRAGSPAPRRHPGPPGSMPSNREIDLAAVAFDAAMNQAQVALGYQSLLELPGQVIMSPVGLGHDQKAGRVLV